jgi:hydroxymethylglutaryl-CoA reductase (NADPH)
MAFPIPSMLLKQLYTRDSLTNSAEGVRFSLKNRLSDAVVTKLIHVKIDDRLAPAASVAVDLGDGKLLKQDDVAAQPIQFPLRKSIDIVCAIPALASGMHKIEVKFEATPFGVLTLKVDGSIVEGRAAITRIPRDNADNYSEAIIQARQALHRTVFRRQADPYPPLLVRPAHAPRQHRELHRRGAGAHRLCRPADRSTASMRRASSSCRWRRQKGTLVASYNRGMKVLNLSGGVK